MGFSFNPGFLKRNIRQVFGKTWRMHMNCIDLLVIVQVSHIFRYSKYLALSSSIPKKLNNLFKKYFSQSFFSPKAVQCLIRAKHRNRLSYFIIQTHFLKPWVKTQHCLSYKKHTWIQVTHVSWLSKYLFK